MVPMHAKKRKGALHEPPFRPRRRSRPRARPRGLASRRRRTTRTKWFMVPMHSQAKEGVFHEPIHPRPLRGGEQALVRVLSVPLLGGVRGGFMVPMHAKKRKGALHEPPFRPCRRSRSRPRRVVWHRGGGRRARG